MADSALDRLTTALADRYRIQREAGAGGMATVYLADDLRHHRQVALKVLRPELAATMGPERFFREIRVAARLQHPHILPLHDSGESDGFLWFVMPFVTGESLRARLDRQGELPIGDAVRILVEVADALSHAHAQGVVHRDIKPDNVLLSGRHALVTDFGVARAVSEAAGGTTVTTAGVALGTPAYMAPEQAAADPQLDHRVDIYALGVLGYELLTGRTPFAGLPPAQTLAAHVSEAPQPIRRLREACPPGLEEVLMRCLAKRPADRWQSADELLHALEPFAVSSGGTTPAQTRPTTGAVGAVPRARAPRSRTALLAGIGLGLALAALAGWATLGRRDATPARDAAGVERVQLTASGSAFAPALSPDGSRLAFAERACDSAGACVVEIRVQDVAGAGVSTVARGFVGVGGIEWSEDARWLLLNGSMSQRWGAYVVPALGGAPRFLGCCNGTVGRGGDTALVVGPLNTADTARVLRRVTMSDGVTRDSLVLTQSTSSTLQTAREVPGSDRLLVTEQRPAGDYILLMDRGGRRLDSVDVRIAHAWRGVFPDREGFLAPVQSSARLGALELVRYALEGRDRISRDPVVVARGIGATTSLQPLADGSVLVTDGIVEFAAWTLERRSTADSIFASRLVARSTSLLMGSITPDGERLLLLRTRPSDPAVRDISVVPFSGGPEVPLGPHRDVEDWDLAQDGRAILLGVRAAGDSIEVREVAIPGGQSRVRTMLPPGSIGIETLEGGGLVFILRPRGLGVRGRAGARDTIFTLPASEVGELNFLQPLADGASVLTSSWDAGGDSIVVHRVSLRDGRAERLFHLYAEGDDAPEWFTDGSVLLGIRETQYNSAWYRAAPGATTLQRLGVTPHPEASYRFSRNGLRGVARERVQRTDVYLLKGLLAPRPGR